MNVVLDPGAPMLGLADHQGDLFDDLDRFLDEALQEDSIYAFFHREREALFPDEDFADLFDKKGRRSVPPSVIAVVMALQRLEGLSDREAVERYTFDARWRYATGVGGYDTATWTSFAHTVLVDMRMRLRRSARPNRVFEVALQAARQAGIIGKARVLDSTPLHDAVATMDTITLIRSAVRALLKVADPTLAADLRGVIDSGDDYASSRKPQIDWEDEAARRHLVDACAKDGFAMVMALEGRGELAPSVLQAAALLCTVLGQDLEERDDGSFAIARRVAPDRVISVVDTETRHGHKTSAHGFDGYKGHVAIDPDCEIVTATAVTPGNVGDAAPAAELLADLLTDEHEPPSSEGAPEAEDEDRPVAYGDNAYGTGELHQLLHEAGVTDRLKTQDPVAPGGRFAKDRFSIDLHHDSVTCPAGITVAIRRHKDGSGVAAFKDACATCPLAEQCTVSPNGRVVHVGRHESVIAAARKRQRDPHWRTDYRQTRPKVERKLAHLMRRAHGGRRARVRGIVRVGADFALLAAAHNLARLAHLGLRSSPTGWSVA